MMPKLRIVTFNCLKNAQNRVGILLDDKSVVDLSQISKNPAHEDMLKFIDGGRNMVDGAKTIAKCPPVHAIIDEKNYTLKAPIPLPRFTNNNNKYKNIRTSSSLRSCDMVLP